MMRKFIALILTIPLVVATAKAGPPLENVRRIVFLGDSITYAGGYIEDVEACLRVQHPALRCEFLDLGLPSETVSGLSEPGHAEGKFPRPDLHERLDRVLEQTKPDLIVACYGMNDGIYYPFSPERFAKYQEGMAFLREHASARGVKVLHLTPPVFDALPIKARTLPAGLDEYRQPFEGYDDVLQRYSDWLLAQRAKGWDVVDIHGPMRRSLDDARQRDPKFRLADDGVHIDATGHWLICRLLLDHWKAVTPEIALAATVEQALDGAPKGRETLTLIRQKQAILKDSWLTATGHKRPGMSRGLPLEEAERKAAALEVEIRQRLGVK
jgi:lysophospholipase L1-like esterase